MLGGFKEKIESRGKINIERVREASSVKLHQSGELRKRGQRLWDILQSCQLCPRMCGVNRLEGEKGFCQADAMSQP